MTQPDEVRVQINLLGRFTAARDGARLADRDVGSRKGRTLLKLLLLEREHSVSLDRIAEVVWPDGSPPRHERIVATLVSRLRAVLGKDSIEGGPAGYRVAPGRFEIDLDDAERLTAESVSRLAHEPILSLSAAERALELLARGDVLEEEPYAQWAEPARMQARALRRHARHCAWRAARATGDQEGAVRVAGAALADDPLDEEACRAVMTAHHDAGRPAKALGAYEQLRRALAEEMGVDPSPESRALHLAILREEPLPPTESETVGGGAGAFDPRFVGRTAELIRIKEAWEQSVGGRSVCLLVVGEAGIGKTRLGTEIAGLVQGTGGMVIQTRCYEAERSLFLQPMVDVVRSLAVTADPDALREAAGDAAGTLAQLVPEVGLVLRPHDYQRATAEIERRRSFEAITSLVRRFASLRPLLIFIDDLHNAGSSTLELLHYQLRRSAGARLMVLATLRVEEGEEALAQLGELSERIDLGHLSADAVERMAATAGAEALADRILMRTGGHPLFVVETLRAIAEGSGEEVPSSLMSAVLARVARTGPAVEELLRAGAVLGSAFELKVAADMLDVSLQEAARRAQDGLAARLLVEGEGNLEFANDLVKEILYRTTPAPIRIVRHLRAAELLQDRPESVAVHATGAQDWHAAARAWLGAARQAFERYANRDGERMLEGALAAAGAANDPVAEAEAYLLRGRIREALNDYERGQEDQRTALELARGTGQRRIELQTLRELGGDAPVGMGRPTAECLPYLLAALDLAADIGDDAVEASVLTRLAVISTNKLAFEDGYRFARRAVDRARRLEDDSTLALALDGLKTVAAYAGNLVLLEHVLPELTSLTRRHGPVQLLQWAEFESSFPPMARGEWDSALTRLNYVLELNHRSGYTAYRAMFLAHLGWVHRSMGRYDEARAIGTEAVEAAAEVEHPWWIAFSEAMLGWTLIEGGRVEEAVVSLTIGLAAAERDGSEGYVLRCLCHLGLAQALMEDTGAALETLRRAEPIFRSVAVPEGEAFLHGSHGYLAAARAFALCGVPDRAEGLVETIREPARASGWVETATESDLLIGTWRGDDVLVERALRAARELGLARLEQLGDQSGRALGAI